jgi:L-asparaginase II
MPAALALVTRGELIESIHYGTVAVVDIDGKLVSVAGEPDRWAFFRSSAKPFQAVPLIESGAADRFGFDDAELALCCSSHNGLPWQQRIVAGMLAKLRLDAGALACGNGPPYDEQEAARVTLGIVPASPLQCDCSGKHAGMLAACLQLGLPVESYLSAEHPLQRMILGIVAEAFRCDAETIVLAPDGCSLPTFGAPLHMFATAFATFADPDRAPKGAGFEHASALKRLRAAMAAHPRHIAGPGELDTDIIDVTKGRLIAKLGAEGLLCIAAPERGLGIAISVLDGSERARGPIALSVLEQLDLLSAQERADLQHRQHPPVTNFNGWDVGEVRADFALESP